MYKCPRSNRQCSFITKKFLLYESAEQIYCKTTDRCTAGQLQYLFNFDIVLFTPAVVLGVHNIANASQFMTKICQVRIHVLSHFAALNSQERMKNQHAPIETDRKLSARNTLSSVASVSTDESL